MGEVYRVYTDGGCSPNPGPGGWGAVIVAPDGGRRELSGGEAATTNNRMELTAALEAVRALPRGAEAELTTDSLYLKNGVTKWVAAWRRKGWKTASGDPVKNRDLWEALDAELPRRRVRWAWTRGHAGDELNERAHALASAHLPATAAKAELPLGDDAVHAFLGVAFSGPRRSGAWAAVMCEGDRQWSVAGRVSATTSNRLHLLAAIEAVRSLSSPSRVNVYTPSTYLATGASEWLAGWKRRGWRTKEGAPVASAELWRELDALVSRHRLRWVLTDGADIPPEAEAARELARERLAR